MQFFERKRKPGPVPKALELLRTIVVTVKLTIGEAAQLDEKRGHHGRSTWMRAAALDMVLIAPLSSEWQTTWSESARLAACLTQINNLAQRINTSILADGEAIAIRLLISEVQQTRHLLAEFRASIAVEK